VASVAPPTPNATFFNVEELVSPLSEFLRGIRLVVFLTFLYALRAVFLIPPFLVDVRLFVVLFRLLAIKPNLLSLAFCLALLALFLAK